MVSPACAVSTQDFPHITFAAFSKLILETFNADTKLDTVLIILFSILENPEIFNHHGRTKYHKHKSEYTISHNSWISGFSEILLGRLPGGVKDVFGNDASFDRIGTSAMIIAVDKVATTLGYQSYTSDGKKLRTLKPVNLQKLQPIHMIVPKPSECQTETCEPYAIKRHTISRDIPQVTLLKGSEVIKYAYVLQGKCAHCNTIYAADRETFGFQVDAQGNRTPKY